MECSAKMVRIKATSIATGEVLFESEVEEAFITYTPTKSEKDKPWECPKCHDDLLGCRCY